MKKQLLLIPLISISLSSCNTINETMNAMQRNREAIDTSTCVIMENSQAIEEANKGIEENRRQLDAINKTLKKASES